MRGHLARRGDRYYAVVYEGIDPATGKKVPHTFEVADPTVPGGLRKAKKLYVATVQNNRLEMSDSKSKLEKRAKELIAQGHKVSAMRITKKDLHQVVEEISPPQIKALIGNLEQTTLGKNTAGQAAVKGAILDAQVRMMNTPGRLERHLKRRNVLGNETDIFESMISYNRGLASAMTNYELGHEMAEADAELQAAMKAEADNRYDANRSLVQDKMASELRGRIRDTQHVSGPKILSVVKDITFLRHLASPHYTLIQLTQPIMMTMPVLSAKYGRGAAWKEMMKVMHMGGVRRSLGRGFKETWRAAIKLNPYSGPKDSVNFDDFWLDVVKNEPDAPLLKRLIASVVELGYGASSGIEAADVSEAGMNRAEIFLKRMVDMAKALPESAESVNRYTTAIATVRLAKRKGLSDEAAIREAVLTVEETQGGYGAANNPTFFNNPLLAPATQFRKFSLAYGQLFYRNLAWSIRHADPEQKKIARKTVAKLALATVATAGAYGLAPVEIARHLVNVAAMLGFKDDDWEEDENQIQEWFAKLTSEGFSEALFRGAPRLANLDLSGSLGVDNLAMFGQPEELTSEGIYEWLAKAAAGAPGAMAFKAFDGYQNGDIMEAIPWPKFIKSLIEAKDLAFTGTVDKKTGEKYMEPLGVVETVYKGLGFRTASEAREWEAGGGGYQSKQDRQARYDRRMLMAKWSNASPSERHEIFAEDVREWNREHRGEDGMKIDMGDLRRSKKERGRREKERLRD